jgi:hypothetical protein
MAKSPEGMTILTVEPRNYAEIIERSKNTEKRPYSREDLMRIRSEARSKNNVALIMFMDADFWKGEKHAQ